MNKTTRTILIVIVVLAVAGGLLLIGTMIGRMRAARNGLGPSGSNASGALVAVSADGNLIAADPSNPLPENTVAQKVGNLNVYLALSPYPPVGFQEGAFDVTLKDAQGQPVTDARISLNLTMPAMPMPPNSFEVQPAANGIYHGTGILTMRGLWLIEVIIEQGGQKQSAYFEVGL